MYFVIDVFVRECVYIHAVFVYLRMYIIRVGQRVCTLLEATYMDGYIKMYMPKKRAWRG